MIDPYSEMRRRTDAARAKREQQGKQDSNYAREDALSAEKRQRQVDAAELIASQNMLGQQASPGSVAIPEMVSNAPISLDGGIDNMIQGAIAGDGFETTPGVAAVAPTLASGQYDDNLSEYQKLDYQINNMMNSGNPELVAMAQQATNERLKQSRELSMAGDASYTDSSGRVVNRQLRADGSNVGQNVRGGLAPDQVGDMNGTPINISTGKAIVKGQNIKSKADQEREDREIEKLEAAEKREIEKTGKRDDHLYARKAKRNDEQLQSAETGIASSATQSALYRDVIQALDDGARTGRLASLFPTLFDPTVMMETTIQSKGALSLMDQYKLYPMSDKDVNILKHAALTNLSPKNMRKAVIANLQKSEMAERQQRKLKSYLADKGERKDGISPGTQTVEDFNARERKRHELVRKSVKRDPRMKAKQVSDGDKIYAINNKGQRSLIYEKVDGEYFYVSVGGTRGVDYKKGEEMDNRAVDKIESAINKRPEFTTSFGD